jgi:hypothetical protein
MRIATPYCFHAPFAWKIFSHFFTLSLCFSLPVRYISCRQQMARSYFLIQSTSVCFLIRELRLLTFTVIIRRYVVILVGFVVFDSSLLLICLSICLVKFTISHICMLVFTFLFLCRITIGIFCSTGLVVINCFSFCLSRKVFISLSIMDTFVGYGNLGWQLVFCQCLKYIILCPLCF